MLHFFRKIRRDLLANSQFFKYLKYAIGEILLVVIGILIALYINNQNEIRKEQEQFDLVLVDVEKELVDNISWIRERILELARQDSLTLEYFIDSVKFENYNLYLTPLAPWGRDQIRSDYFEKLNQFSHINERQDAIMNEIISLKRNAAHGHIDDYGDSYIEIINNRWKSFMQYDWYNSWMSGKISSDERFLDYVMNNPDYRKMAMFMFMLHSNYRNDLANYEQKALSVYNKIYRHLDSLEIVHCDSLMFQYSPKKYQHYIGKFQSKWCSRENYVHDDSIAVALEDGKLIYYGYRSDGPDTRLDIIPINKYHFRTNSNTGVYHLDFDEQGEVSGMRYSGGERFTLQMEKIR